MSDGDVGDGGSARDPKRLTTPRRSSSTDLMYLVYPPDSDVSHSAVYSLATGIVWTLSAIGPAVHAFAFSDAADRWSGASDLEERWRRRDPMIRLTTTRGHASPLPDLRARYSRQPSDAPRSREAGTRS